MRARTAVLVLCAIISAAARGAERERVLSFHSDIAIGADDSLTITETIRLVSTGNKIKRGILRDFPVRLWDGTRRKLYGFEVKGVLRGGQKEPYAVDRRARFGYARIKIGNENVLLPPGEHTYAITYRTTNHIRFFDDHDELYFNVNGTEWDFPIDKVSATITLPPGGKLYKDLINGFTGAAGEKGKDYKAKRLPDDRIFFETTRAFDVGENLTIVVPLDKGAVKQPPAPPEEKILHFDSDIELGADGVVQVRETIRLVVGGVKFDDGFTRDFPLVRRGLYERTTYRLAVQEVLRNGNKDLVLVNTDEVPDHARVSVGDYGAPPRDGEHTYTLRYTRAGHVRFGSHHDELVLDVTGAGWEVPIEKVCATVSLPQGAKLLADRVAGATGARGKDFTWRELPDGRVAFETTRPLQPGEGLTIAVPLAKGAVAEPSVAEKRRAWISRNLPAAIALGGFAAVVAYLVVAWVLFGGWPLGPAPQPRAEPPTDPATGRALSPAEVACVANMGFDESCVAPALLDMGVRGYLTIQQKKVKDDDQYTLIRRPDTEAPSLPPDEQAFAEKVFGATRPHLTLKADDPHLFAGVKAMRDAIEKEWGRNTFRRRTLLRALGWTLAVAATVAAGVCRVDSDPQALWILLAAVSAPTLVLVCYGVRHLFRERRKLATNDPKKPSQVGYLLDVLAIGIGSTALIAWLYWLSHYSTIWVPLGVFGMWLANATVGPHLRRYTRRGRLVMHQAKQLALHMTTKLSDTAPRPTGPEPFESLLPYAMALGIANRWATNFFARFGQEVAVAAMQPGESHGTSLKPYVPLWFRAEQAWDWIGDRRYTVFAELQHRLRKNLPSGRAAAATSSSGSSSRRRATVAASGARGYSGGGSGGGGGKGW